MLEVLGEGAFGLVNMAEARFPNGEFRIVAVKMLKEGKVLILIKVCGFLKELAISWLVNKFNADKPLENENRSSFQIFLWQSIQIF